MTKQSYRRWLVLLPALLALACGLNAQTVVTRSISDFLNTQGAWDGYPGPVKGFLAAGDLTGKLVSADYAGLVNRCWAGLLPTTSAGTIVERPLQDGSAEVTVILHTQNALTFVTAGDIASGPVIFGQRWNTAGSCQLVTSSGLDKPVLGDVFLQVVMITNAPGEPIPDLQQILFQPVGKQQLRSLKMSVKAVGPMHNLPGIPDGTIGKLSVEQNGLLYKYSNSNGKPGIDGFTVERIELKPIAPN